MVEAGALIGRAGAGAQPGQFAGVSSDPAVKAAARELVRAAGQVRDREHELKPPPGADVEPVRPVPLDQLGEEG